MLDFEQVGIDRVEVRKHTGFKVASIVKPSGQWDIHIKSCVLTTTEFRQLSSKVEELEKVG